MPTHLIIKQSVADKRLMTESTARVLAETRTAESGDVYILFAAVGSCRPMAGKAPFKWVEIKP